MDALRSKGLTFWVRPAFEGSDPKGLTLGCVDPICPEERREAAQRLIERNRLDAGLPPDAVHAEHTGLPLEHGLDPPHEPVAAEDRQDVVPVLALRLRHVHLEAIAEVEQRLRSITVM